MADTWTCKECQATLRCGCQSQECDFDYTIRGHLSMHGCTCDIDSKGNRAKCAHCTWYED